MNESAIRHVDLRLTNLGFLPRAAKDIARQLRDWTVMVFLNAKNDLEPFDFHNFGQMAQVGSTDKVNVVVEFGRPQRNHTEQYGGWSKTLRYRVTNGMLPTEDLALEDLGKVNMGDGEALGDFVTWARTNYAAKRTMLVIWDHGQGWRRRQAISLRAAPADLARIARARTSARTRLRGRLGKH